MTVMDIKPIETKYNGYEFRSRLEARWAVFFSDDRLVSRSMSEFWDCRYDYGNAVCHEHSDYSCPPLWSMDARYGITFEKDHMTPKKVWDAYDTARSARFEHGRNGSR